MNKLDGGYDVFMTRPGWTCMQSNVELQFVDMNI